MPSVAQVPEEGVAGKKRRWEDSGEVVRVCRYVYPFVLWWNSGKTPRDGKERQVQH